LNSILKTGKWLLSELLDIPKNNLTVFSCFHCGGGSTMGYKLAGFNVLGGVEIDKRMMAIYKLNHNPKYSYLMDIREFNKTEDKDLPIELFNLDILDGSPPCSSFSDSGNREKDWGKKKQFAEGQASQTLDDLFFYFIDTADKLKPKIVIAENVPGLLKGNARGYVKQIFRNFRTAGYEPQLFKLDASNMGAPQKRERVFFIARRLDLNFPRLNLEFKEPVINLMNAFKDIDYTKEDFKKISAFYFNLWKKCKDGAGFETVDPRGKGYSFNKAKLHPLKPCRTLDSKESLYHWSEPRHLSKTETCRIQTFPDDYNFLNEKPEYVCGMSVPPFMIQRIASEIYNQLFKTPLLT